MDWLSDLWDSFKDAMITFFSFGWVSDLWEGITGSFDNIGELSVFGVVFGLVGAGIVFLLRNQMLEPFLRFYSPPERLFWSIVTYAGTFIAGYFMGKYFESNG